MKPSLDGSSATWRGGVGARANFLCASSRFGFAAALGGVDASFFTTTSPQAVTSADRMNGAPTSPISSRGVSRNSEAQESPAKRRRLSTSGAASTADAPTDQSGTDSSLYDDHGARQTSDHGSPTTGKTTDSTNAPSVKPKADGGSAESVPAAAAAVPPAQQFPDFDMHSSDALFNDSATLQTAFQQRMQAANGARSGGGGGDADDSADELASGDEEDDGTAAATAPPATASGGTLRLPRFEKPSHSGKPWPAAYHTALIKFIAQDTILRGFMTVGTADGSTASLRRFSDLTEGPTAKTLQRVLTKYRNAYNTLKEGLSAGGLSTRTSNWTQPKDWAWLEKCESHHVVRWLRILHDEVFVDWHNGAPRAVMTATGETAGRPAAARASTRAVPSTSQAAQASPSALPRMPSVGAGLGAQLSKNDSASSSTAAGPSSGIGTQLTSLTTRTESQFATLQEQLKQQGLQIAFLQTQSEQQSQLLSEQAALLQQHADDAELKAKEAKALAQKADAQAEKIDRQSDALKRVEEQLTSLLALARERT